MQGSRLGRARLAVLAAVAAVAAASVAPSPGTAAAEAPALDARAWVLADAEDGEVLAARRPHRPYPMASTTKLMTAYVARRELRLGEEVVAPAYVPTAAESLLGLEQGERIEVRDLLYGLILASGNDAAVALAEGAAGSVRAFVRQMNSAARRLGLEQTSYANPIGLDEPGNYASAADLVDLTLELREDRVFRRIFDAPEAVLRSGAAPRTVINRNLLVRTVPSINGVKTGYTLGAGYVLVGSESRRDVTLVSAVMGAPSEAARDAETLELLDYGFSLYRQARPVERGQPLAAPGLRYQDDRVALVAARTAELTVRRGQRLETEVRAPREVEGPIARRERLGEVVVSIDGERVEGVPLIAARAAPGASAGDRIDAAIPGPRLVAWLVVTGLLASLLIVGGRLLSRRRGRPERPTG